MENTSGNQNGGANLVDPAAHLALLDQAKQAPGYEDLSNPGPWWYAPFYASFIALQSLAIGELHANIDSSFPYMFIANALNLVPLVHAFRNRRVKSRATRVGVRLVVVPVLVFVASLVLWYFAIELVGYETFLFPWAVVGWVLTTAVFLALRAYYGRIRDSYRIAAI